MARKLFVLPVLTLLLLGCGDPHRPAVHTGTLSEDQADRGQADRGHADQTKMPPSDAIHSPMMAQGNAPAASGPIVDLDAVQLKAPDSWVRKQPQSGFVLAEFGLPKAEGDSADGRLTVSTAGGSVKDNVDRWRSQFAEKPEKESQEQIKVGTTEVTLVDFSGTYVDGGMMGPGTKRSGYRMLGAIFQAGGRQNFVKAYGPAKTMTAHQAEFRKFLESLRTK